MLQRLFARHASEDRIENAVDHGKTIAQQDALRERSHLILERLARKQAAAREEEIEARRAAREAAERTAEEAKTAEPPAAATAETAETETSATPESSAGEPETVSAQSSETVVASDEAAQHDFEGSSAAHEEPAYGAAEPASQTETADRGDYFSDDAPLRASADDQSGPRYDAPRAEPPAEDVNAEAEQPAEMPADHQYFEPSADAHTEHTASDIHDDPEAMERIRKKAEEAKARIAARLEQLEADEQHEEAETDSSNGRLDLGEDAPPVSPDDNNE